MLGNPRRATTFERAQNWRCLPQHPYGTLFHHISCDSHTKIKNGCPADSSVAMFANGQNDKVRFKVQMFGFNGEYADNNVWLHCVVRVCGDDCEKVEPF